MFGIITGWKKHRLAKYPEKEERPCAFVPWSKAESVLLFVAKDNVPENYEQCIFELLREGRTLNIVYYVRSAGRIPDTENQPIVYVSPRDISFQGHLKKEALKRLLEKEYDWAIDLSFKADGIYDYLFGQVNARCKIGMGRAGGRYDIEFPVIKDANELEERLIRLLKNVNTY